MAHHNLQVYITLFPLDNTAISRRFVLDPDHVSILVGRASKTANKGLKPDATNTWFDSPIMSREHASFVMDSCAKILSLRDHGSTHGTWINDVQLAKDQESPLSPGVFVTFGSKVMSGPITYQPQTFRVTFQWSNWSRPLLEILVPPSTPQNKSITYSVPDESEYDSGSDGSGASVTFVKRRSRVFHVPSSDEESDDNDSLKQIDLTSPNESKDNDGHTDSVSSPPSMPEPSSPKAEYSIHSDSQSDSQSDNHSDSCSVASDMEERSSEINDGSSSEGSEDEGPDILPFENEKGIPNEEKAKATEAKGSFFLEEIDLENNVQPRVMDSSELAQCKYSPSKKPPRQGFAEASSAPEITKIFSDRVDESSSGEPAPFPSSNDLRETAKQTGKQVVRAETKVATPWTQHNRAVGAEERTQAAEKASTPAHQSHPCLMAQPSDEPCDLHQDQSISKARSPSPSDAALAKNASKLGSRLQHEPWHNHLNSWYPGVPGPRSRDVEFTYESFVPTAGYDDWETNRAYCTSFGEIYYGEDPFLYAAYDHGTRDPANTGEPSSYVDGPFVGSNHSRRNDKANEPMHHEVRFSTTSRAPVSTTHTPEVLRRPEHSDQIVPVETEKPIDNAGKSSQASKLDISNLLQQPLPVNPPGSLKRKADEITCDELEAKTVEAAPLTVNTTQKGKETDTPQMPDILAPEVSHSKLADINISFKTIPNAIKSTNVDVLERPSKKAKRAQTAAVRATGLAKFALGVGVGALGVVGAFVASIPASVRDEAWREFQNS